MVCKHLISLICFCVWYYILPAASRVIDFPPFSVIRYYPVISWFFNYSSPNVSIADWEFLHGGTAVVYCNSVRAHRLRRLGCRIECHHRDVISAFRRHRHTGIKGSCRLNLERRVSLLLIDKDSKHNKIKERSRMKSYNWAMIWN